MSKNDKMKVATMCDKSYFEYGKLFLKTRDRVKADFTVYSPNLTDKQINTLKANRIEHIPMLNYSTYQEEMQFLKFEILADQLLRDVLEEYKGFTFVDFDTFFINDWSHIFDYDFDFGVTIRKDFIKKRCLRAYTNGGVIFAKHRSYFFLKFAQNTIKKGGCNLLPEYGRIWKTLEEGRPKHKTHYRTELRWWVDQVFFSALALHYFEKHGYRKIASTKPDIFKFHDAKIALFDCNQYNRVESEPKITNEKNVYIRHLKSAGRKSISGVDKTREKLNKKK